MLKESGAAGGGAHAPKYLWRRRQRFLQESLGSSNWMKPKTNEQLLLMRGARAGEPEVKRLAGATKLLMDVSASRDRAFCARVQAVA